MNMKHWPYTPNHRQTNLYIPRPWHAQWEEDMRTILTACAENKSHAMCLAVHEMADRIRRNAEFMTIVVMEDK